MAKVLLTRDQFKARFGYDPETESKEDARPWTGMVPSGEDEEQPTKKKVLLTKQQYVQRFGVDPDTGEKAERMSQLEAAGRGGAQVASLGFVDELAGVGTAVGDKLWNVFGKGKDDTREDKGAASAYREGRDEYRAGDKVASEDWKKTFIGGQVAGGLATLPAGGAAAAGLKGAIKTGAALGAATGVGSSEGDLTKGEVGDVALDAVKGAGLGAAAGAGGHLVGQGLKKVAGVGRDIYKGVSDKVSTALGRDAEEMAAQKLAGAAKESPEAFNQAAREYGPMFAKTPEARAAAATPEGAVKAARGSRVDRAMDTLKSNEVQSSTKVKAFGRKGSEDRYRKVLDKDDEFTAALADKDPIKAQEIRDARLAKYGKQVDKRVYDAAQKVSEGVSLDDAVTNVKALRSKYEGVVGTERQLKTIDDLVEKMQSMHDPGGYGAVFGEARIPFQQMRRQYRIFQDKGWRGGGMFSDSEAAVTRELQKDISGALQKSLDGEIQSLAASGALPQNTFKTLKNLNQKMSAYYGMGDVVDQWAARTRANAPTLTKSIDVNAKAVRNWIGDAKDAAINIPIQKGVDVGRRMNLGRAASAARKEADIAREAMAEVDALTPGSPPVSGGARDLALARVVQAKRSGVSAQDLEELARAAINAGIPSATVQAVLGQ